MLKKNDVISGVYGLATGDALGVPVEFMSREQLEKDPVIGMRKYGSHNQPIGTWSDDTSMTLATLDAMCRGLNYGIVMDNFVKWVKYAQYTANREVFDIGGTTCEAINQYLIGEDLDICGANSINSNGNGSLMRMLPMIYYVQEKYGLSPVDIAVREIYKLSGLTHNHIISKVCCVYYVYIGMYIIEYGKERGIHNAIKKAIEAVERYYFVEKEEMPCILQITGLDSLMDCVNFKREDIESTGYVLYSLVASLWCLWNTSSYEEAVLTAVNLGQDTDTIGAITGSLAGLYYGYNNIPTEWIKALKNKVLIDKICNRFYEQYK